MAIPSSGRFLARALPIAVATALVAGLTSPLANVALAQSAGVGSPDPDTPDADPPPFDPGAPTILEGDILTAPGWLRGIGVVAADRRWSNGEVPYVIDPSLAPESAWSVMQAVERWNAVSGVTLFELGDDDERPFDHLVFTDGPGCASWVGRQGGPQEVWMNESCTSGSAMHEIGHVLGLEHEHTRPDRDQHVQVLWDNIAPDKHHNFALAPDTARELGPYDLDSIMHYGPANFSLDGRDTLAPHVHSVDSRMGQRDAPSEGDLAAVARLYASDLSLSVAVHDGREVSLYVTNHHVQGAHDLVMTVDASLERVSAQDDEWQCASAGEETVECRLPRLAGHASSHVVLALERPGDVLGLGATLRSKTPDLDPSNNGGSASAAAEPAAAAAMFGDASDRVDDAADPSSPAAAAGGVGGTSMLALLMLSFARGRRRRLQPGDPSVVTGSSPGHCRGASPSFGTSCRLPSST